MPNQKNLKESKLNLKERGLLSIILEFANIPKWNLNLKQIAKEAGVSLNTVQKIANSLIKKNWLKRTRIYSPQGVQGSYCKYELNLNPDNTQGEFDYIQNQKIKREIVNEYLEAKNSQPEIQTQKTGEHNKTIPNKTKTNKTYNNKTLPNKNIVNMREEIAEKINSYIWTNLEEFEDFYNQFIVNKAKMMNKLPGEVNGIFRAMETRINTGTANMSDLTALKEWRQGYLKATTDTPKKELKKGFNDFVNEQETPTKFNFDITEKDPEPIKDPEPVKPTKEQLEIEKANKIIDEIVEKAIKEKRIIERRTNSWDVDGIQVDGWTFIELAEWLEQELKQQAI